MEIIASNKYLHFTKKKINSYKFFWVGISIYILGYTLSQATELFFNLFQSFQAIGLLIFFYTSFRVLQFKIDNNYLKFIFFIYCGWHLIMIFTGIKFDYSFFKYFFFNLALGGIIYFAPLILLFPKNVYFLKTIFNVIIIFGIFYLIYDLIFVKALLNFNRSSLMSVGVVELSTDLSFPVGFLLLTYNYHSNKIKLLAAGVIVLTLFFAIIRARRGLILMSSGILISSYILYLFSSKRKFIILYLTILVGLLGAMYASTLYKTNESIFGFIMERGDEDTRTNVEIYFNADMKNNWIMGKGIRGEYFCPDIEPNQVTNYRNVIETGYLQIILKGGIISLALLLLMAIPAIIIGLFYSKNILTKAAAIWIFLALISMYPTIVNTFSLRYLLVWISIGICFSKNIRTVPENEIRQYFKTI